MRWAWVLVLLAGCDDAADPPPATSDRGAPIVDAMIMDAAPPDAAPRDAAPVVDVFVVDAEPDYAPSPWPTCPAVDFSDPPAGLDPVYTRHVDVGGVPLLGSEAVSEAAFRVAVHLITQLFEAHDCYGGGLVRNGVRIVVLAPGEAAAALPEYRDALGPLRPNPWDDRGLSASLVRPVTVADADNLLHAPDDRWPAETVLLHELAHTLFEFGAEELTTGYMQRGRLNRLHAVAQQTGVFDGTWAATDADEYWAEGVQIWYGDNPTADPADGVHGPIGDREALWARDPSLADLLREVLGEGTFPLWCDPAGRDPPGYRFDAPERCNWRILMPPPQDCADVDTLRAMDDSMNAEITFVNRRFTPVSLSRIDERGRVIPVQEVPARALGEIFTKATHPWLVTDAEGACLRLIVAEWGINRVILE